MSRRLGGPGRPPALAPARLLDQQEKLVQIPQKLRIRRTRGEVQVTEHLFESCLAGGPKISQLHFRTLMVAARRRPDPFPPIDDNPTC